MLFLIRRTSLSHFPESLYARLALSWSYSRDVGAMLGRGVQQVWESAFPINPAAGGHFLRAVSLVMMGVGVFMVGAGMGYRLFASNRFRNPASRFLPTHLVQMGNEVTARAVRAQRRLFWEIDPSQIQTTPLEFLSQFAQRISTSNRPFRVLYKDSLGQDLGGLTRDFVSRLFTGLLNGSHLTSLKEEEGHIPCLSTNQRDLSVRQWGEVGTIFAKILDPTGALPVVIGQHFHPVVFSILWQMREEEISQIPQNLEEIPEGVLNKALGIYLQSIYLPSIFSHQKEITAFIQEGILSKNQRLAGIESREEFFQQYPMIHAVSAILGIGRAMQEQGVDWSSLKTRFAQDEDLKNTIQGFLSREELIRSLGFLGPLSASEKNTQDYLHRWIQEASWDLLSDFLFALTGSGALIPRKRLQVSFHGGENYLPSYHTCTLELGLSRQYSSFEAFQRALEKSFEVMDLSVMAGFQLNELVPLPPDLD